MHLVFFSIGPIQIRFYGLMYVVAVVAGYFLLKSEVRRKEMGLTPDDVMNLILWVVLVEING